ncbi:MAG TPA: MG2 domain-containing protein [Blastocatellia bacterium]|nr:MG2 domain-containing protein [Blastocatellia bacterium]
MKLRLFSRVAVLCSAILHVACFTSTSSVTPSIHSEHDKDLAIWFAPGITEVCLHLTGESGAATVQFELLDNTDRVVADAKRTAPLRADTHLTARLPVDPSSLDDSSREALKWERLRYTVTADGKTSIRTVSVVDAMPDLFALRLTAPDRVEAGTQYRVAAHTSSPSGDGDASGVTVLAVLKTDDAILSQAELKTDENGTASFALPLKADSPEFARLVLNAFKDGAFETQLINVRIEPMPSISISTDKPLYQPGQTIHCRTLLLGEQSHRALAEAELKLTLRNNKGETVGTATESTDRFGVAAHDFKLAEEVDLGDYTLEVKTTSKPSAHQSTGIEVSRYELPTFSVAAEPDKSFYLGGDVARITLRANYLFGKPVEDGRVKIVADHATGAQERNSNTAGFSGVVSNGHAEIRVGPLRPPQKTQYQQQFVDRTYSAYVTDATSGRTEQTRFTLRVSREALHLYIRMAQGNAIEELPVEFYVSAYYPDGSPAQCDMTIDLDHGKYRSTVRSNQYGLAKVTTDYIAPLKKDAFYKKVSIKAQALDGRGQTGKTEQEVTLFESHRPRVVTDRSIYRTGEEPLVTMLVPGPDRPMRLEAIKDGKVITAETLKLVDGRTSTTLQWNSSFEGMVTLAAYEIEGQAIRWVHGRPIIEDRWFSYGHTASSTTNILFQPLTKLKVDVQLARGPLKPGEQADVEFHVTDAAGKPVETSLGVAVVDKAVSALNDANKNVSSDYLSDYLRSRWGYSEEVAGMNFSDLLALDFSRPISEDLSLVGELLLQRPGANLQRASARDSEPGAFYQPLFSGMRERVAREVTAYFAGHQAYPEKTADLPVLSSSTGGQADLRDPWGVAYRFKMQDSKVPLAKWNGKDSALGDWKVWRPVNTPTRTVVATSAGRDHLFGTTDDIEQQVMSFPAKPLAGRASAAIHAYVWGSGAPGVGVRVRAVHLETGASFETVTQTGRRFKLTGLPPGMYRVTFESGESNRLTLVDVIAAPGTQNELRFDLSREEEPPVVATTGQAVSSDVKVLSGRAARRALSAAVVTSIGGRLHQGYLGEPLELARAGSLRATIDAARVVTRSGGGGGGGSGRLEEPLETPRLRQHFPETLVWQPQIVTDATGTARLNFPVADSITTWQLAVVGSSVDGRLGSGSTEIRAFQDFIAEPQLPPALTEGDEISLPVVLRNYSDQSHAVRVTLDPADWFSLEGSNATQVEVAPNVASRTDFRVRALTPGDFSSRVTAAGMAGSGAGDAIERPVQVSRYGQEMITARGDLLDREASYEFEIPPAAIPGSARAVIKLYPNVLAGALAAIEGMAQRPWGCLEQTLSSTYENVLVLRYLKQHGRPSKSTVDWEKLERQARRNLEDGYQRVLSFPASTGGFSYFGDGEGDVALTAYALRFFADAGNFIEVDDAKRSAAAQWLLRKQRPDGSWTILGRHRDERPGYALTAYIAGALAVSGSQAAGELQRAFDYLDRSSKAMTDPYSLALYALAARAAGNHERERSVAQQLISLAVLNRDGAHWQSPHRTLFYGWGGGGEIETTALVLQALAAQEGNEEPIRRLVNQGLLYLARTRDYQGSWHSTQATLLSLQALMAAADNSESGARAAGIDLVVNGKPLKRIDVGSGSDGSAIEIDLTTQLQAGANRLELRSASWRLGVQLVYRYYVRWDLQQSNAAATDNFSLSVKADKEHAAVGEPVTYSVGFKRSDWEESGMSILEIGLPPGADVDRATLRALLAGHRIDKYSITPNSMIFYVWPRNTTTRFSFTIRPRLAMTALTSPSLAFDYYNPDLRQALQPSRLTVE